MEAQCVVSEQKEQNGPTHLRNQCPTLWIQLAPPLQKQLAQHWAKLIQQTRHRTIPGEEGNDARG
jgi:hypothetical protein